MLRHASTLPMTTVTLKFSRWPLQTSMKHLASPLGVSIDWTPPGCKWRHVKVSKIAVVIFTLICCSTLRRPDYVTDLLGLPRQTWNTSTSIIGRQIGLLEISPPRLWHYGSVIALQCTRKLLKTACIVIFILSVFINNCSKFSFVENRIRLAISY